MRFSRTLVLGVIVLIFSSLFALAQSAPTSEVCQRGCFFEYHTRVDKCGAGAGSDACIQAASLAYRTCLATCPKP